MDKCFVPSDALYKAATDRNVSPSQIVQHGLPIRKGFWSDDGTKKGSSSSSGGGKIASPPSKGWFSDLNLNLGGLMGGGGGEKSTSSGGGGGGGGGRDDERSKLREKLDLKKGLPTVLIVGGGDGMGGITQQATALASKLDSDASSSSSSSSDDDGEPSYQMVVVCGNNEAARIDLEGRTWGGGVEVKVLGFVNNMDEYMRASDAIVTKAGPGTIAEASICGLPCMLSSYL